MNSAAARACAMREQEQRPASHGRLLMLVQRSSARVIAGLLFVPQSSITRYWHSEHPPICFGDMALQRMDNVLIVVDDLEAAKRSLVCV